MLFATLASVLLAPIAFLHFFWAAGSHWPAQTESDLAHRVTGFSGVNTMPPRWASVAVGVVLLAACHVLLVTAGAMRPVGPVWVYHAAQWGLVAVFAARGIAAYVPHWRALTPEQPFATLDRRYFGPLCLLLSGLSLLTTL